MSGKLATSASPSAADFGGAKRSSPSAAAVGHAPQSSAGCGCAVTSGGGGPPDAFGSGGLAQSGHHCSPSATAIVVVESCGELPPPTPDDPVSSVTGSPRTKSKDQGSWSFGAGSARCGRQP